VWLDFLKKQTWFLYSTIFYSNPIRLVTTYVLSASKM